MRKTCQKWSTGRRAEEECGRGTTVWRLRSREKLRLDCLDLGMSSHKAQECLELGFCSQPNLAPQRDVRREGAPWKVIRAGG